MEAKLTVGIHRYGIAFFCGDYTIFFAYGRCKRQALFYIGKQFFTLFGNEFFTSYITKPVKSIVNNYHVKYGGFYKSWY